MCTTLKFTKTNLFLMKMDCLNTVEALLYFSNLKLNFLLCLDIVNLLFLGDSVIFCIVILIYTSSKKTYAESAQANSYTIVTV